MSLERQWRVVLLNKIKQEFEAVKNGRLLFAGGLANWLCHARITAGRDAGR